MYSDVFFNIRLLFFIYGECVVVNLPLTDADYQFGQWSRTVEIAVRSCICTNITI